MAGVIVDGVGGEGHRARRFARGGAGSTCLALQLEAEAIVVLRRSAMQCPREAEPIAS